jgi:molybdate transport system substrate-binding protein
MATELEVLSTTAMKSTLDALMPQYERSSGHRVLCDYGPSTQISKRIADGEIADVAIITGPALEELIRSGTIATGSRVDIARSEIGVAVRAGTPRPNISTPQGFKAALLAAKSIAMSNPVGGGQSGAHLQKVFEQLGIADTLRPKISYGAGGPAGLIGLFLLRGEAELGIQQMPELMAVPGIDIIGPLPSEVQSVTLFSAGTFAASRLADAAQSFVQHLRTPAAMAVMKAKGLEPVA